MEKTLRGIPASPGIAMGRAILLRRSDPRISPRKIALSQVKEEVERFQNAIAATHRQLEADRSRVTRDISETVGRIFEAHMMILEDPVFLEEIESSIRKELMSAEYLVWTAMARH